MALTIPPIFREPRMGIELAGLLRSPLYRNPIQIGDGEPVILIPGLYAGDASLTFLATFLKRLGYHPRKSGINVNVDCSEHAMKRLEKRLIAVVEEEGRPAIIIGHSRGGAFARVLAVRHPDKVRAVIALGSPLVKPLEHVHPLMHLQLSLLSSFGDRGIRGFCHTGCMDENFITEIMKEKDLGRLHRVLLPRAAARFEKSASKGCCADFWKDAIAAFPPETDFLSLYSRSDGIVEWESCLDQDARHQEVKGSHCGMAGNRVVYRAIANELARINSPKTPRPAKRATSKKATPKKTKTRTAILKSTAAAGRASQAAKAKAKTKAKTKAKRKTG